jgi:hypothetical protein
MKQLHISTHHEVWNEFLLSSVTTNVRGASLLVITNFKNQNMVHVSSKFLLVDMAAHYIHSNSVLSMRWEEFAPQSIVLAKTVET